jgi:hypothetical protein
MNKSTYSSLSIQIYVSGWDGQVARKQARNGTMVPVMDVTSTPSLYDDGIIRWDDSFAFWAMLGVIYVFLHLVGLHRMLNGNQAL